MEGSLISKPCIILAFILINLRKSISHNLTSIQGSHRGEIFYDMPTILPIGFSPLLGVHVDTLSSAVR